MQEFNKKTGQALTGRPVIESGKSVYSFSNFYFINSTKLNQPTYWESLGFKKNSKSIFDYEHGKALINEWNLSTIEYDRLLKSLVNFLGV